MKYWLTLMVIASLVSCASYQAMNSPSSAPAVMEKFKKVDNAAVQSSGRLVKSPHAYVIKGPKGSFGGFVGTVPVT
jgi:hypothetical protein